MLKCRLFSASACIALAGSAQAALAQTASTREAIPNPNDIIIVTGSRIARPSVDNPQPTSTINAETFENRGYTNVGQALQDLPGFALPDSSQFGTQANGFNVGQQFVNLYNLGSQRTLTLVNGRRFVGANAPSIFSAAEGGSQVDLNTIPTKLIERIETVSIGGAPIYGSDAIAGTVNIILKRDFQGVSLDGQTGVSQRGDMFNWRVRGLVGQKFAGGRGNITVNAEYSKDEGLLGTQRSSVRRQRQFVQPSDPDSPYSLVLADNVRTFLGTAGGIPYFRDLGAIDPTRPTPRNIRNAAGQLVQFGPRGTLIPYDAGQITPDATTFIGGDALNFAEIDNLRVNSNRFNAAAQLSYELSDAVRFFGEAWYSRTRATNLRDQPVYNTAFFSVSPEGSFDVNGNYIVRLNNPYLSAADRETIRASLIANGRPATDEKGVFYLGRANTDLSSGKSQLKQDLYRFVGGFEGDFDALGHKWTWNVSGNYGRTKSISLIPSLVEPNLRRALNVTTDATGNIVCAPFNPDQTDPTQPPVPRTDPNTPPYETAYTGTISQTCAPLNIFGSGSPSQSARDYVTTIARTKAVTTQRDFVATLSGAVAKLPGGDLAVVVGYENRRESSSFAPDAYYTTPLGRSIPILGLKGHYTTNELFGEFRAPLIGDEQDIPLIHELEINGAARFVRNSVTGKAFTWTAGGRWAPVDGVVIRGNFTRAIRAPAVSELFVPNQPAFDGGYDPCDVSNLQSGPSPATRQANCAAAGLPADFVSNINSITVPITVVGNPGLKEEYSNSWTVGTVLTPRFLRGFSLAVDYINIDIRDAIASSSAQDVLTACYDATDYPNNPFCGLITRSANPDPEIFGQVETLSEPYINQGRQVFRAVEVAGSYMLPLGDDSRLTFGVNYQHTLKEFTQIASDGPITNRRNQIGNSKDIAALEVTYERGPLTWYNQVRYVGPARFDATEPVDTREVDKVDAWTVWNTSLSIEVNKQFRLRLNVDNVLDVGVPDPGTTGNAVRNTYYQGIFGRSFLVGAEVNF
ncbi:TonB-dependent receptor [Sphingobium sp. AN558]|uniref:TonB-dependent receptor domain-containing protein n=1 Tax=Sphingobium sp. AN558 TaxID=3133442 RepID=UPI0030C55586